MNISGFRARFVLPLVTGWLLAGLVIAQETAEKTPQEVLGSAVGRLMTLIEPPAGAAPRTLTTTLRIVEAEGLGKDLAGRGAQIALQAPDRLAVTVEIEGRELQLGRNGQELWLFAPGKKFGVIGLPDVPRFRTRPDSVDCTPLPPFKLPVPREQLLLLPLMMQLEALPAETVGEVRCHVIRGTPQPQAIEALKIPKGEFKLWVRETDSLPARLSLTDQRGRRLVLEAQDLALREPWPAHAWRLQGANLFTIEKVARAHLERFIPAAMSLLNLRVPPLGPATGEKRLLATEGAGRLEEHDGTKVLFLKGSPEDMGRQHGVLMRRQVRDLVDKILYGVGVGSSFEKGRWFFGEIEDAQARLAPFIDERYLREMDALALAANLDREEVRLANFFPELFHCSGFAVYGRATVDGRLYHGRILDYLRGVGLEPNAVVIVHQPDYGHAWVNVSYGGFIGSVTAMNEKRISIGEMGGRGEGHWDGKPMAQLVREVMEKASTLDEAVEIMRRGPRTCEYYYVIADGNTKRAAGIAATPDTFEVVKPGEAHPRLPHAIADAVLLSAGDRYEKLVERVRAGHGKLDAGAARRLMDRPVAMNSNIHSVLFAPETLDFWVANADSQNVASHARYTHYNLAELLRGAAPPATARR
jgi:hypothetical protein